MKKMYASIISSFLLLVFSATLNAQCSGGRYHSLIFPGAPTVTSDVVYGSNTDYLGATVSLKLDIYRPACDTATNRPLVVFAHGGSFMTGDKADAGYAATAIALAQLGYVVASINYRLGFETTLPAAQWGFNSAIMRGVHDARAAVRFLRNNALTGGNTYGIDPNKIFFGGVSAGGIMALHLAYQNTQSEQNMSCNNQPGSECGSIEGTSNNLNVSSAVTAIISISGGIRDLNWIGNNDVPVCMAHGTVDGTVPYGSGTFGGFFPVYGSSSIAAKCNSTSTKYCFTPMIGQDHTPANTAYVDTVATLMRNFLEHFMCNTTLNCAYNGSPAVLSPAVSIAITSGTNPTCGGAPVTFTATATNGGTNLSYQWKKNGSNVGTGTTYTLSSPANNDVITCVLTTCASVTPVTSNSITMTVSTAMAPTVSIAVTSGSNPTCTGVGLTFTATPTNGGSSPAYQWKKGGSNVGTGSTYTLSSPANGDVITCVLTSNAACANPTTATSNAITVSVSSTVAPTINIAVTSGANPSCTGAAITFTGTPTNGGSSPSYQWKKNGTNAGTGSTYSSSAFVTGDVITCVLTSNSACANPTTATSNTVTMTVNPIPTISKVGNVLTSSSTTGNQWYLNGQLINGAVSVTYTATASGSYTVKAGGCTSQATSVVVSDVPDEENEDFFTIFPNPSNGNFTLSFTVTAKANYGLDISNTLGQPVYEQRLNDFTGTYNQPVDLTKYGKGIYLINLRHAKGETVKRVVVY